VHGLRKHGLINKRATPRSDTRTLTSQHSSASHPNPPNMADPMSPLSPEKLNATPHSVPLDDDLDMGWTEPPSSPFLEHVEPDNQENIAPATASTPVKSLLDFDEDVPQSAFKTSPEKKGGLKERSSPPKRSPVKNLMDSFEEEPVGSTTPTRIATPSRIATPTRIATPNRGTTPIRSTPKMSSPAKEAMDEQSEPATVTRMRKGRSPSKPSQTPSVSATPRVLSLGEAIDLQPTPSKRPSAFQQEPLRDNEGLTTAMRFMDDAQSDRERSSKRRKSQEDHFDLDLDVDFSDYNPDKPGTTSAEIDDTCFSDFSEMPGLDMTKFSMLKRSPQKSPRKGGDLDVRYIQQRLPSSTLIIQQATPRARAQKTPSTARRSERTPSPTPRRAYKENDTTNLLLDFTAQMESFGTSRRGSTAHGRASPAKSTTEPNLRSFYQSQRSPAKSTYVSSTPGGQSRNMLNLLDFELPPPPTPRSRPTVTIREMESAKSYFQSQISSLTASLSGKEAEVESLSRAIADAERRVGEAHEAARDERSAREYAEAQMEDWKTKGEEVQDLLQHVQTELAHNDSEREHLLARLAEMERRAEDAENRSIELETRLIEAESKNIDMTTFVNEEDENQKIYTEMECQSAIAEKVNEVARDLHAAYKAKHEKKIKALKDNYQKKADERCKELRVQITHLEQQVEEAEKKQDDTFSNFMPEESGGKGEACRACATNTAAGSVSKPEDIQNLEAQRSEIESLKAKLAGLQSELQSLRKSQSTLLEELEAERVEKGELVAAAEQMLVLCGERMESMQQEDFRRSQAPPTPSPAVAAAPTPVPARKQAPPEQNMRNTGFLAGGSSTSTRPTPASHNRAASRPGSAMGDRLGSAGGEPKAKASGMRTPGGFGFGGSGSSNGSSGSTPGLNRSTSANKSRLLSNIERMGGGKTQE
jgi:peptidoglycan hydrolase CwlO-like protein